MASFMQLEEKDILESLLLALMDDEPMVPPTPTEEATLLDDDSRSQEAQAITSKPECSGGLEKMEAAPQDMQSQPLPPVLGLNCNP